MRTAALTLLALIAFAANSLLCRVALKDGHIDFAGFTLVRLLSGALVLAAIGGFSTPSLMASGSWRSALALFVYALAFSFAYVRLSTATGALLLFGAVQVTMIGSAWWRGDRLATPQKAGLLAAVTGLVVLLLPGLAAPSPTAAVSVGVAGIAWGLYSLHGRSSSNAIATTAGNFLRAALLSIPLVLFAEPSGDGFGLACAAASGALASGLGYTVWYLALPRLPATLAATAQLTVPVIAAIGGVVLLDEAATSRLLLSGAAILGGIALIIAGRAPSR